MAEIDLQKGFTLPMGFIHEDLLLRSDDVMTTRLDLFRKVQELESDPDFAGVAVNTPKGPQVLMRGNGLKLVLVSEEAHRAIEAALRKNSDSFDFNDRIKDIISQLWPEIKEKLTNLPSDVLNSGTIHLSVPVPANVGLGYENSKSMRGIITRRVYEDLTYPIQIELEKLGIFDPVIKIIAKDGSLNIEITGFSRVSRDF